MRYMWLATNHSFNNNFLNCLPDILGGFILLRFSMLIDIGKDSSEGSFVAYIISVRIFVEYEFITVLINGIVSEMHAQVTQVRTNRRLIFLGPKSSKTLLIYESP